MKHAASNTYRAWGLTLRLPFDCPALPYADSRATPDVEIVEGSVPRTLAAAALRTERYDAEPGRYLLRGGSRAGRFLIEDGTRITLERNPKAEDAVLAFHFGHTVIAALLHQRGHLVLHASAAIVEGAAAVISGESGAGKSTLLAALAARGYAMLCDDVTALRRLPAGAIEVLAGPPQIHLCAMQLPVSRLIAGDCAGIPGTG